MARDLSDLRTQLSQTFSQAWENSSAAQELETYLRDAFTDSVRAAYKRCATEGTGEDIITCLQNEADSENFPSDFRSQWTGSDLMDLRKQLKREAKSLWTTEMRNQVRKITKDANIRGLYKQCSRGDYAQVSSELGDGMATPSTYQECLQQVSEAKNLSNSLYDAWS